MAKLGHIYIENITSHIFHVLIAYAKNRILKQPKRKRAVAARRFLQNGKTQFEYSLICLRGKRKRDNATRSSLYEMLGINLNFFRTDYRFFFTCPVHPESRATFRSAMLINLILVREEMRL